MCAILSQLQYLSNAFICSSKVTLPNIRKGLVKVFSSDFQYLTGSLSKFQLLFSHTVFKGIYLIYVESDSMESFAINHDSGKKMSSLSRGDFGSILSTENLGRFWLVSWQVSYSWHGPQFLKGCRCIGFLAPVHKAKVLLKRSGVTSGIHFCLNKTW